MGKRIHKITGIIGARDNAQKYLFQMDIPEDVFSLDMDEMLENMPVMKWLEKKSREIAPGDMDTDTLLGMLEFAKLGKEKSCMTRQLQKGQKRRLLLLRALLCCRHYMILWDVFEGLGEDEMEKVVEMLVEFSTFADIVLVSGSNKGFSICDEMIYS